MGGASALGVGVVGAVLVAGSGENWTDGFRWILYLLAAASLAAILGLVFGLPRALSNFQPSATERYKGNSNLEEISDWLTKLLVGVGLVQLTQVPGQLRQLSDYLSQGMTVATASAYVSAAIVDGSRVFRGGRALNRLPGHLDRRGQRRLPITELEQRWSTST